MNQDLVRRNEELLRIAQNAEFEKQQMGLHIKKIEELYERSQQVQGTDADFQESIKRQAELELQVIQQQSHV
jgi:hypothetical protein